MSPAHRKFAVAYLFLVALPLAGLVGVLRAGHNLTAPVSIDGTWSLQADFSRLTRLACRDPRSPLQEASVVISQSGNYLVVSLPGISGNTGQGLLEGTNLQASVTNSAEGWREAGCAGPVVLSLAASVEGGPKPTSLAGTLRVENCSACTPLEFRALREPLAGGKGAR